MVNETIIMVNETKLPLCMQYLRSERLQAEERCCLLELLDRPDVSCVEQESRKLWPQHTNKLSPRTLSSRRLISLLSAKPTLTFRMALPVIFFLKLWLKAFPLYFVEMLMNQNKIVPSLTTHFMDSSGIVPDRCFGSCSFMVQYVAMFDFFSHYEIIII